ncbi:penicillin-binding protein activator, partial [Escherichia coli]
ATAAPIADVAEQPQPQTVDGVASPAQASVSDLTGEETAAQPVPVSAPAASTAAVSAPANPSAELKIYDTSSQPLSQILNQVQQDGASIVVGPLLKNNVEELLKSNTPLNVLALNQPENIENRVNICYFALSPEDEARDAAR